MGKTVIVKGFPEDLHHRAKVYAAINATTMKQVIIEALIAYLDREEGDR